MKALIALLFGICVVSVAIYLHVDKKIEIKSLTVMFALAIFGGLAIANFDVLKRWKGLGMEVETARDEIQGVKADALKEIRKQVDDHKNAISVLMRSASDLSEKLEKQKSLAEAIVEKAKGLESEIEKDQVELSAIKTDVLAANKSTQSAKASTEELAKILTRISFLQITTRNQFGTAQANKAIEKITEDLNRIVNIMIPDPNKRNAFVQSVMNELK
jgi:chromosome segregation ATPase